MSRAYSITTNIEHADVSAEGQPADYYWRLEVTIDSSNGVSSKPFLMECFLDAEQTLEQVDSSNINFIRVLLESDISKYVTDSEVTARDTAGWISYRSNSFTNYYYRYTDLKNAEESLKAILKSLTRSYSQSDIQPLFAVVLNLSTVQENSSTSVSLDSFEGDIISITSSGGSGDVNIAFTGVTATYLGSNKISPRPKALLYRLDHIDSFVGGPVEATVTITDLGTAEVVTKSISITRPTNYGNNTEEL